MYDLSELDLTRKEMAVLVLAVFVFMVVVFSGGYMCGLRNAGENVHDNGNGISDVGKQLGTAVSDQQQITDGIKDAEQTVSGIVSAGEAVAESAQHIEAGVGEAAGLIDSSQQILGGIRNRGQKGTAAN